MKAIETKTECFLSAPFGIRGGKNHHRSFKIFCGIAKLSPEERKKYTIVDDRTILFSNSDSMYHPEDIIELVSGDSGSFYHFRNRLT